MRKILLIILIFISLNFKISLASNLINPNFFSVKDNTPGRVTINKLSYPSDFLESNNLVRKTGSFYSATGEIILVKGKIFDSFGIPISNTIVKIWQTNSAGKYQNLLSKGSKFIDEHFSTSGKTTTDNLGRFRFVTIMPGFYKDRAPYINFDVYHPRFGLLQTEMYFENHPRNNKDYNYLSYSPKERSLITAKVSLNNVSIHNSIKIVNFDIIMNGSHRYKNFGNIIKK